jgi:hypothetical protein
MMLSYAKGFFAGLAGLVLAAAAPAGAQSATQLIRMEIRPISRIAVRGTTTFTIPARSANSAEVVTSASAAYAVTTNEENRRITVALDEPMPAGVTLKMRMDAPAGALSGEEITLSEAAQSAVTGISRLNASDLGIAYSLVTSSTAVVPKSTMRTVRITLVSGV